VVQAEGWEVLNAVSAPYVDHVCNANNLSQFTDETFAQIYASHIVEHLDYKDELITTLREWHRVLAPGGVIYISVPDLDILAELLISRKKLTSKKKFTLDERFFVMRMIFGGHLDQYDYHVAGLNEDFLSKFLHHAGYVNIRRVENFGLFDDDSSMKFKEIPISLNIVAEKPRAPGA